VERRFLDIASEDFIYLLHCYRHNILCARALYAKLGMQSGQRILVND